MRRVRLAAAAAALLPAAAAAQLRPNADWRTIATAHFDVHFTPALEPLARRAAANAERAYAQLAAELAPARGRIDLVVSDDVDYSNGYATPLPTNRIVIYAHPPAEEGTSLRFYDDWSALVITHELVHIFHLDRTRGWWRVAQHVFGRAPGLFPNQYAPSWVTEGLAVYYETRLTSAGRLASSFHRDVARAAAADHTLPALGAVSLTHPRFPAGESVYIYGSLLLEHMARTHGPDRVRRFVDASSGAVLPFMLGHASRRAFGVSFDQAWAMWSRDLLAGVDTARRLGDWRTLTREGWTASFPRWRDSATLVYAANVGRESAAAYEIRLDGARRRLGRRSDHAPNTPRPDGSVVFSQFEFTTPYEVRSDLFVARGGRERRLTRGARLLAPDARADGELVAAQELPGTTRIVRVSADGTRITPLTLGTLDVHWSDARWSRAGDRVVAVRHGADGTNAIVVVDTTGRELATVATGRVVNATPSWVPGDSAILFTSDREGAMNLYRARLGAAGTAPVLERLGWAGTAIVQPELSPDGRLLAASLLRGDGYHLVTTPYASLPATAVAGGVAGAARALPAVAPDTGRARRYSPWRSLVPRYWYPAIVASDSSHVGYGFFTSGQDIVGRHAYVAEATYDPKSREASYDLQYRFAGLGRPVLTLGATAVHDHFDVTDSTGRVRLGDLGRRKRIASLASTFVRPRVRTSAALTLGASYEWRDFATDPDTLRRGLASIYGETLQYPTFFAGASWSNAQRPTTSISPEDGVALSASVQHRWRRGTADTARTNTSTFVGVARAYKSLDLPGFAHHVVAVRGALGLADARATAEFSAGGASGTSLELVPGYAVGDVARTFGVRGFPPSAQRGTRAVAANAEYRAPLSIIARGIPRLPLVLSRASFAAFAEGARAWCPGGVADQRLCVPLRVEHDVISSAGAEINLDTAFEYDVPLRFRFGVAVPITGVAAYATRRVSPYVLLGSSF